MLRRIRHIALLLFMVLTAHGQDIGSYEYWLDADYGSRVTAAIAGDNIEQSIDIGNLSQGVHYLNFRARSSSEGIGPMYRYIFFVPGKELTESDMTQYEYWLDADYEHRISTAATGTEAVQTIDISGLSQGIHYLNFRAYSDSEGIGPLYRYIFFVPGMELTESDMTQYEYWLDADYEHRISTAATGTEAVQTIDISGLSSGIHYLNFRAYSDSEGIGPMYRYIFFVPGKELTESDMTQYEYWLDADYEHRISTAATGTEAVQTIDISGLSSGIHYLNFRAYSDSEGIGPMYRYLFFVPGKELTESDMTQYEYWLDADYEHRISTAATGTEAVQTIDISGLSSGIHYLNFRAYSDSEGIGPMYRYLFFVHESDNNLEQLAHIEYWLDDAEDSLFTMSVDSAELTIVMDISHLQTDATHYFNVRGINRDGEQSLSERLEFFYPSDSLVMDSLPTPEIVRNEDGMIAITVPMDSVSIYYTTDGSEPTAASTLYSEPFLPTQNCTIKAIAMREGFLSSEVTTFEVDWFKVAAVVFEQNGILVTLSTPTEGATIYYSTDGSEPSIPYEGVLTMAGDCTIKAFAVKDGYTQSATTSYEFHANGVTVATPVIASNGNRIGMSTTTEQAVIYYTLDGSVPNDSSMVYMDSIIVDRNCTIKAIALRENYYPSQVVTFEVDWFKVADVVFEQNGSLVTLSTTTEGATIYYSLDDSEPSIPYEGVLTMTGDCTIKAFAVKDGYTQSATTSYEFHANGVTVATPVIVRHDNKIGISTATDGATIHYTLDGSEPTAESAVYTDSITVTQNCTIKAIALRENYYPSQVTTFEVDWFTVSEPVFALDGYRLTMSCSTAGASIYYNTEGQEPSVMDALYASPIDLTEDCIVKAVAIKNGFNNSEVTTYQFRKADATVSSPVIAVDGNRIGMSTTTEQAVIHYTLDGSEPTVASAVYSDSITVTQNCTIKAIAMRENYYPSQVATFEVDWFITAPPVIALSFDGRAVTMTSEDGASIYYTLDGTEPTTASLRYEGEPIALSSLCTVKAIATAEGRESSEVMTLIVNSLFDGITARIGVGGTIEEAFQWCGGIAQADGLAAIVWSRDDEFPADAATSIRNPNLLLYVNDYTLALGVGIRNVVSNGLAQRITLTDNLQADGSYGPANFYAPQPFRVQNEISYTHRYTQTTRPDECRGWETIALPFTVQAVTHETNGGCVPFASYVAGMKPFWLCRLTEQGFVDADSIRANEPYIISMPESEEYSPYYRLGGTVTFSAREVSVPATEPRVSIRGGASFVPCFQTTEASQSIYALNVGEERSGYAEGSLFDRNYRDVRPFEAYRTTAHAGVRSMPIADELGGATGIDNRVEIKDKRYSYYNLQGVPVKTPGKGVYIRNGKKVVRSAK